MIYYEIKDPEHIKAEDNQKSPLLDKLDQEVEQAQHDKSFNRENFDHENTLFSFDSYELSSCSSSKDLVSGAVNLNVTKDGT